MNSPELTAKKFVPDPFINKPGARLYRTGDRARWLTDGQIEYIGRVDDLIKIRGYRIEPNEIIAVLDTAPGNTSECGNSAPGRHGQPASCCLYRRWTTPNRPTVTELRDLLRSRLPDYMIPAIFVVMPDLPMTFSSASLTEKLCRRRIAS